MVNPHFFLMVEPPMKSLHCWWSNHVKSPLEPWRTWPAAAKEKNQVYEVQIWATEWHGGKGGRGENSMSYYMICIYEYLG